MIASRGVRTFPSIAALLLLRFFLSGFILLIGLHSQPLPTAWALLGDTLIPDAEEAHEEEADEAPSEVEESPEVAVPPEELAPSLSSEVTGTVDLDTSLSEDLLTLNELITPTTSTTSTSLSSPLTTTSTSTSTLSSGIDSSTDTLSSSETTTVSGETDAAVSLDTSPLSEPTSLVTETTETSPTVSNETDLTTTLTETTATETLEVTAPVPVSAEATTSVSAEEETPVGDVSLTADACVSVNSPGCGGGSAPSGTVEEVLSPSPTSDGSESLAQQEPGGETAETASSSDAGGAVGQTTTSQAAGGATSTADTEAAGQASSATQAKTPETSRTGFAATQRDAGARPATTDGTRGTATIHPSAKDKPQLPGRRPTFGAKTPEGREKAEGRAAAPQAGAQEPGKPIDASQPATTTASQPAQGCPEGQVPGEPFELFGFSWPAQPVCQDASTDHGK